jgi:hypothetical protein
MTLEEHEARQTEIRGRLAELDTEFAGQRMSEEAKSEWNRLNEEFEDNTKVINELRPDQHRVKELSDKPELTERGASFHTQRPCGVHVSGHLGRLEPFAARPRAWRTSRASCATTPTGRSSISTSRTRGREPRGRAGPRRRLVRSSTAATRR